MSTQAEEQQTNVEDISEEQNLAAEEAVSSEEGSTQEQGNAEEHAEQVSVTFGDEESPPSEEEKLERESSTFRELRAQYKELSKQKRALEEQLKKSTETVAQKLGEKPTLESCEYDEERFEKSLAAWFDSKRKVEAEEAKKAAEVEQQQREWADRQNFYVEQKAKLSVKDFSEAEEAAKEIFSVTQQGIILKGAKDPATLVYGLGKNLKKAKELASIKDPVKFAFAAADMESQMKVTNKTAPPAPEKAIAGGNARTSGTVDSTLERLRAEAERTGDYSKVTQYRQQLRERK